MMTKMDESKMLTIVTNIIENNGCKLVDFDAENRTINIEGPEEAKVQCAIDLEEILG
jgi:hypothetical protein